MKPTVYIETSVISYLTGRPTRDMIIAAHKELTRQWWETRQPEFDAFVSELVLEEAARGDRESAARRMAAIKSFAVLKVNEAAVALAERLVEVGPIPRESAADALHIAIAAVHGMDYLLTWNCKHLANAAFRQRLEVLVAEAEYECPVICTPEELME